MAAEPKGVWPAGSALDALDRRLSHWAFQLELPSALEVVLSVPGMWFCCGAVYMLLVAPAALLALAPQPKAFLGMVCLPVLVAGMGVWLALCSRSMETGAGVHLAYGHFQEELGALLFLGLPHMVMLVSRLGSAAGRTAAAQFYAGTFVVQKLAGHVKHTAGRARPVLALAAELRAVKRALPDAARNQSGPREAHMSFPSGDTAQAAVFAAALLSLVPGPRGHMAAAALVLLTGFGRMYFHCHHLLDVVAGGLLGIAVALVLKRYCRHQHWRHVLVAQILMVFTP